MVTAALVAQSAEALRGLNYDKQNWQSIFSGNGNITITLPDGTTWTGPAWNSITTSLSGKAAKGANNDITSLSGLYSAVCSSGRYRFDNRVRRSHKPRFGRQFRGTSEQC
jgi:hypothetical protein